MLEFRQKDESSIKVFLGDEQVGSITDQCCYTLLYLTKITHPVKIKYEVGKGGFLNKKNSDGTYIYRDRMKEVFQYLYDSEQLRILLRKKIVELRRNHVEEGKCIQMLKEFEKEIKL